MYRLVWTPTNSQVLSRARESGNQYVKVNKSTTIVGHLPEE